jgi:YD repeat-containing protein
MKISLLSLLLCAVPLLAARYPGDDDHPNPAQVGIDNFYLRQTNHDQWEGMPAFYGEDAHVLSRDAKGRPLFCAIRFYSADTVADSVTLRYEWDGDIPSTGNEPGWTPSRSVMTRFRKGTFVDSIVETYSWDAQARVVSQIRTGKRDSTYLDAQGRVLRDVSWRSRATDSGWSDPLKLSCEEYFAEFRSVTDTLPQREFYRYLYSGVWSSFDTLRYFGPANRPDSSVHMGNVKWYRYDGAGRRILEGTGADTAVRYEYDAKGRLVKEAYAKDTVWFSYDAPLSGISRRNASVAGFLVQRTADGIRLELGSASLRSLELRDPRGRLLASFPALAGAQGSVELKARLPVGAVLVRVRTDRGEVTRALTLP